MGRILVVDDEADILRFIVAMLEDLGHLTAVASDGAEALQRAAEFRPHLVILDINLPRLDGYEVCRQLKATSAVPIILMSADYISVEDARRGSELGADEYVVKPFLREVLLHHVDELLAQLE
jgi:DNA-binding response OmpR family regulator